MLVTATRRTGAHLAAVVAALALLVGLLSPTAVGATPTVAPANLTPTGTTVAPNPVLRWDPVPGTLRYRVQVATDPSFPATVVDVTTYGTSYAPPAALPAGDLFWRVAAIDATGTGPFASASFTVAFGGPLLVSPPDLAELQFPTEPPTFRWAPVEGVKSWTIEIDDAPDFVGAKSYSTEGLAFTYPELQVYNQPFFWRVQGTAANGQRTAWSEIRQYEVHWDTVPVLLTPADDVVNPISDVVYTWTPVPGASTYELEVSRDSNFNPPLYDARSNLKATAYSPSETVDAGSYFWRVRAVDGKGNAGPWSDLSAFTVGGASTAAPGPVIIEPIGPAPDPVVFSWLPVARASHYEIWVATDTSFTTPLKCKTVQTSVRSGTGGKSTPGSCNIFGLSFGTTYYWKVRGIDGPTDRLGLWSDIEAFTRSAPEPVQTAPADGATVALPILDWEPVPGTKAYRVEVRDASDDVVASITTAATSWVATGLTGAGPYSWSVAPTMVDNQVAPQRALPWPTFSLAGTPPTGPTPDPIAPIGGARSFDMPTMQWQAVPGGAPYVVWYRSEGSTAWTLLAGGVTLPAYTPTSDGAWLPPGRYEWVVRDATTTGPPETTDTGAFFEIDPLVPVLTSPTRCVPGGPCEPVTSSPVLDWEGTDYARSHTVHLAFDQSFTNVDRTYATAYSAVLPREELPDNNVGAAYFWYVQPCRPNWCAAGPPGLLTPWSGFQKRSEPVTLISPPHHTPASPSSVPANPFFEWEDYLTTLATMTDRTPDDLEAATYEIEVALNPSFEPKLETATSDVEWYAPSSRAYPDGPIYWRVRAVDETGNNLTLSDPDTGDGVLGSLVYKSTPALTGLLPADGATTSGNPTFAWDPQVGAVRYVLEVYRNGDTLYSPANREVRITTYQAGHTLTDVLPAGDYAWRVQRLDVDGNAGPWTDGGTFTVAADEVMLLAPPDGALLLDDGVEFSWTPVAGATSYRFQRSTTPAFTSVPESADTFLTVHTPTSAYPEGRWYWRVQARDADNTVISTSEVWSFDRENQFPPDAPTGVSAVAGNGQVAVSWTAPADDGGSPVTGYTVTADPGGLGCAVSGDTACTVNGLTNGIAYTFTVVATNARGDSPPSAPSNPATPSTVPGAPTGVVGTPGNGQVAVSWTPPASNGGAPISSYTVTASPGGATCSTSSTGCTVNGLTNGVAYTFTVNAMNVAGTSTPSTPSAPVVPIAVPTAPTGLAGTPGDGQIAATWTASSSDGGSPITGYTVTATPGGASCSTLSTACTITGLTNGTPYTLRVTATNGAGTSVPSDPAGPYTPGRVPSAPTGVALTPGDGQLAVAWTAPTDDGGSAITSSTATASPGGATCTTAGTATGCTITGLTNGTPYTVTVTATNAVGTSAPSAPSAAVAPATAPAAPTNVRGQGGNQKATIQWNAPDDGGSPITGYTVTASPGGATCTTGGANFCMVTGLTNLATYTFTVTATNVVGTSPPSAPSAAVTPLAVDECVPPANGPFTDVERTHPFCGDIQWLALRDVTGGYADGSFRPLLPVSRQGMAAFLYRFAGQPAFTPPATPTFSDVGPTDGFYKEIEWLATTGITGGCGGTSFCPTAPVSRQSMAAFLYRFAGEPAFTAPATASFTDVPTTSLFFAQVEWLATTGITTGFPDGTFKPLDVVSRQSMAAFLHRYDATGLPTSP